MQDKEDENQDDQDKNKENREIDLGERELDKQNQVDKKKESRTTPHVNTKISAYDRIVQLVPNYNPEVKPQQEEQKQTHMNV